MIEGKRVCVTGGAGSIGSEIVRQLAPKNEVFILDTNETEFFNLYEELRLKNYAVSGVVGDVRQRGAFEHMAKKLGKPDYLFHAAALKHVTPSGWSPEEYVHTNVGGTLNALRFADKYACRMVNVSTDKAVYPNSIMGATKRLTEIATRDAGQVSVRFGNVMGSRGSVLEIWQRQIDQGQPLTITDERMERYMMTIPEAVRLVIRAAEVGKPGQLLILDMGERVNILKLAKQILNKSRKDLEVEVIGIRPGETLTETLMTPEEQAHASKEEGFWVLEP